MKLTPIERFKHIPGTVIVDITDVPAENRNKGMGFSLDQIRKLIGGDEGFVTDPYHGRQHAVSLKKWLTADPATLELTIRFNFVADPEYVRQHPEEFTVPPNKKGQPITINGEPGINC